MGQLADEMVEGLKCELCHIRYEYPHYHPVMCKTCWEDLDEEYKRDHIKAYNPEVYHGKD